MTKHTPGPWRQASNHSQILAPDNRSDGYRLIATVEATKNNLADRFKERIANCNLIGAAPDLLEVAIQLALENQDSDRLREVMIRLQGMALVAIRKAQGR